MRNLCLALCALSLAGCAQRPTRVATPELLAVRSQDGRYAAVLASDDNGNGWIVVGQPVELGDKAAKIGAFRVQVTKEGDPFLTMKSSDQRGAVFMAFKDDGTPYIEGVHDGKTVWTIECPTPSPQP